MELKVYINALVSRWWLIAIAFGITMAATIFFLSRQTPMYEAEATFVMRPRASIFVEEDVVRAVETLSRRIEINTTYAEIASSKLIRDKAIENLGLEGRERRNLSVSGRVIAGTNVLEITARGPIPEVLDDFANEVGTETIFYVSDLYDVFDLEPLDAATEPRRPVSPQTTLILILGAVAGLGLGVGLVVLSEYLRGSATEAGHVELLDDESSLYSREFFMLRLKEELNRSKRNNYPLALGLIRISSGVFEDKRFTNPRYIRTLNRLRDVMRRNFGQEDIIGRIDETTFGVILLDTPQSNAIQSLEELHRKLTESSFSQNHLPRDLYCAIGMAIFGDLDTNEDRFFRDAAVALEYADKDFETKVRVFKGQEPYERPALLDTVVKEASG